MLWRPLGHQRFVQEHHATARWPAAIDLETKGARTGGGPEPVAVCDGLAVVSQTSRAQMPVSSAAVATRQSDAELWRRPDLPALRAVTGQNYFDVLKIGRTR